MKAKCSIQLFYHGGTKAKIGLDMTPEEVEKEFASAKLNSRDMRLKTVSEDTTVETETAYLTRNELLFYVMTVNKEESGLVLAPANALPATARV